MAAATFADGCEDAGDRRDLEAEFLELLIASERVGDLVDVIRDTSKLPRQKQAVRDLAEAVQSQETLAVEARVAGAVDVLTSLINLYPGEEELIENAYRVITACSGTLACSGKEHEVNFGELTVHLREGNLADGLGARMWAVSRSLASMLVERPELVHGLDVLEIGAGTGLCGILAAKLGAAKVVLTDCEEGVLLNLRECAAANLQSPQASGRQAPASAQSAFLSQAAAEDFDFDPEDADECENLDDFLSQAAGARSGTAEDSSGHPPEQQWDMDNMQVRYMEWDADLKELDSPSEAKGAPSQADEHPAWLQHIPEIDDDVSFDVILGSDIMYEERHAEMVAAVLKLRLRQGGVCLVAIAIRDEAIYTEFLGHLKGRRMAAEIKDVEPGIESKGILGRQSDYHGFVILTIRHASR